MCQHTAKKMTVATAEPIAMPAVVAGDSPVNIMFVDEDVEVGSVVSSENCGLQR